MQDKIKKSLISNFEVDYYPLSEIVKNMMLEKLSAEEIAWKLKDMSLMKGITRYG